MEIFLMVNKLKLLDSEFIVVTRITPEMFWEIKCRRWIVLITIHHVQNS